MKFLLSSFTGLGNQIQKTPLITKIKELVPASEIDLIGNDRYGALSIIKGDHKLSDVYEVPICPKKKDIKQVATWLEDRKHDVLFLPFDSSPGWLIKLARKVDVRKIVSHFNSFDRLSNGNIIKRLRFIYNLIRLGKSIHWVPLLQGRHEIDLNYDLLEKFVNKPFKRDYTTWVAIPEKSDVLERFRLKPRQYICLQPGAANGAPTPKRWHPDNFRTLAECLSRAYPNYKIVLVGDKGDFEHVIKEYSWPAWVINTTGKTDLVELTNLLRYSVCIVAHDSGIMHLGCAVQAPTVALYGPTDYTRTAPKNERVTMLFSRTDAFAAMYNFSCSEKDMTKRFPGFSAMDGIKVRDVLEAVLDSVSNYNATPKLCS